MKNGECPARRILSRPVLCTAQVLHLRAAICISGTEVVDPLCHGVLHDFRGEARRSGQVCVSCSRKLEPDRTPHDVAKRLKGKAPDCQVRTWLLPNCLHSCFRLSHDGTFWAFPAMEVPPPLHTPKYDNSLIQELLNEAPCMLNNNLGIRAENLSAFRCVASASAQLHTSPHHAAQLHKRHSRTPCTKKRKKRLNPAQRSAPSRRPKDAYSQLPGSPFSQATTAES